MKNYLAVLLLHLSLHTLAAAEVPTFTQREWKEYITNSESRNPGPNDILVTESDGLTVTFGSELSSRIHEVMRTKCENPEDEECKDELKELLGIGPTANGLQRRVVGKLVALGGVLLSYVVYKVMKYVWPNMDEDDSKVVEITIPQDQVDEVSEWDVSEDKFKYKPEDSEAVEVDIDANQPKPSNDPPGTMVEDNGDITILMPGLENAIRDSWKKVRCTRQPRRSLQKRVNLQCVAQFAQAILRIAQLGGPGAPIQHITPMDFPRRRTQLLSELVSETEDYGVDMYYGDGVDDQRRGILYEFAAWVAFGHAVGDFNIANGKMRIPHKFVMEYTEEDLHKGKCPEPYYTPFCSNCGGNVITHGVSLIPSQRGQGTCAGLDGNENGYFKGCPCLVPSDVHEGGYSLTEIDAGFQYLMALPDESEDDKGDKGEEEEEEEDNQEPVKQCYKLDADRMADHSNWKFVDQVKLDEAIETFCRDNWADVGYADPWTFERSFYNEDDWNHLKITITGKTGIKPRRDRCKEYLMEVSAGCDNDPEPDMKKNINQFNWKWGGEYTEGNGIKWIIAPQKNRIGKKHIDGSHGLVTDSQNCYSLAKFADHGNKGLNGKPLDDSAKMTLQQCIHRMRMFGDDTDVSCGGLLTLGIHRSKYNDYNSCAETTWACLSHYVEAGESARGKHTPGFSNCWADLMFR